LLGQQSAGLLNPLLQIIKSMKCLWELVVNCMLVLQIIVPSSLPVNLLPAKLLAPTIKPTPASTPTCEPYLQFTVNGTNIDLGELKTNTTKTANATFSVSAYLTSGYNIINASDPPVYNGYFLNNLTSPTASVMGTEQFGMNLKANTSPATFGADPVQTLGPTYGFGQAAIGYDIANQYKYVKNDTIALSGQSTSITNYTISYIFNISNSTVGGLYTFRHVMVAVATY
jgi:hypothetical protein